MPPLGYSCYSISEPLSKLQNPVFDAEESSEERQNEQDQYYGKSAYEGKRMYCHNKQGHTGHAKRLQINESNVLLKLTDYKYDGYPNVENKNNYNNYDVQSNTALITALLASTVAIGFFMTFCDQCGDHKHNHLRILQCAACKNEFFCSMPCCLKSQHAGSGDCDPEKSSGLDDSAGTPEEIPQPEKVREIDLPSHSIDPSVPHDGLSDNIEKGDIELDSNRYQKNPENVPQQQQPKEEPQPKQEPKQQQQQKPKQQQQQEPKKKSKNEPKEQPKEQPKNEPKQQPKNEPKQQPKNEPKNEPKKEAKHESKHEPKKEAKHESKHEPKKEVKNEPEYEPKNEPKHDPNQEPKEQQPRKLRQVMRVPTKKEDKMVGNIHSPRDNGEPVLPNSVPNPSVQEQSSVPSCIECRPGPKNSIANRTNDAINDDRGNEISDHGDQRPKDNDNQASKNISTHLKNRSQLPKGKESSSKTTPKPIQVPVAPNEKVLKTAPLLQSSEASVLQTDSKNDYFRNPYNCSYDKKQNSDLDENTVASDEDTVASDEDTVASIEEVTTTPKSNICDGVVTGSIPETKGKTALKAEKGPELNKSMTNSSPCVLCSKSRPSPQEPLQPSVLRSSGSQASKTFMKPTRTMTTTTAPDPTKTDKENKNKVSKNSGIDKTPDTTPGVARSNHPKTARVTVPCKTTDPHLTPKMDDVNKTRKESASEKDKSNELLLSKNKKEVSKINNIPKEHQEQKSEDLQNTNNENYDSNTSDILAEGNSSMTSFTSDTVVGKNLSAKKHQQEQQRDSTQSGRNNSKPTPIQVTIPDESLEGVKLRSTEIPQSRKDYTWKKPEWVERRPVRNVSINKTSTVGGTKSDILPSKYPSKSTTAPENIRTDEDKVQCPQQEQHQQQQQQQHQRPQEHQQKPKEIGSEKRERTNVTPTVSLDASESMRQIKLKEVKRDISAHLLDKDELQLRHAELDKKEYEWEKPEWAKKRILKSKTQKVNSPNEVVSTNASVPTADGSTITGKSKFEWEKPEWATKKLLRSSMKASPTIIPK